MTDNEISARLALAIGWELVEIPAALILEN
jgi:hypothetical protein